jgi:hypothetical protein
MGDLRGKPLDSRRLSRFLRDYDVRPRDIRPTSTARKRSARATGARACTMHGSGTCRQPSHRRAPAPSAANRFDPTLVAADYTTHGEDGT